jgi:ABC-type uncharacterized transport system permease subunit
MSVEGVAKHIKAYSDAVDGIRQIIQGAATIGGMLIPFFSLSSRTLAVFIASGVVIGALPGYLFTIASYKGQERNRCLRRRNQYAAGAVLALVVFAVAWVFIDPMFARERPFVAGVREILMIPMVFNFVAATLSAICFFLLVGALALSSQRLWAGANPASAAPTGNQP